MPIDSEGEVKGRRITGHLSWIEKIILTGIPIIAILYLFNVNAYFGWDIFKEQYLAIFLGLILAGIFIEVPSTKRVSRDRLPVYDIALILLTLGTTLFVCLTYPQYALGGLSGDRTLHYILGPILVLLVIEATRRTTGWILVGTLAIFIVYALFGFILPSPFTIKAVSLDQLVIGLVMDSNALLGMPLWVAGSIVFGFILFGALLAASGGSQIINDFAEATMGRFRGGPAKMAVVGSSLFGNISGSVIANVSATGVVTIPLMKKAGYKSSVAAAIEAVASTGGQIMPPVMGVTAFLIAQFLSIPYTQVAIAAAVPAILYYIVLFMQVDFEAGKMGLKSRKVKVPILPILKKSWLIFLPAILLVYLLFFLNYEAGKASVVASFAIVILSLLTKETRISLIKLVYVLVDMGRGLLMIGATSALAGLIIGVIYITGIGTIISNFLLSLGGQNLFLLLLITGILCIIMGMGMPTSAIYIILAVIIAPSLVQIGLQPLPVHLFIFYMGISSFITPPVAIAAYCAGGIANADPVVVGLHACRLGFVIFTVPFLFVCNNSLLLMGSVQEITFALAQTIIGYGVLTVGVSGFLFRTLSWVQRLLLILGGVAMLIPVKAGLPYTIALNIIGFLLVTPVIFWEMWSRRRAW